MPSACRSFASTSPTTVPEASMSGPPLFPGLTGVSVWMRPPRLLPSSVIVRSRPLIAPCVMVCGRFSGYPMAATAAPTCGGDEASENTCPANGRAALTRARSPEGSDPTTTPVVVSPPALRATVTGAATTWLTVATRSGAIKNPVPMSDWPQEVAWLRITPELSLANQEAKDESGVGEGEGVTVDAEFEGAPSAITGLDRRSLSTRTVPATPASTTAVAMDATIA